MPKYDTNQLDPNFPNRVAESQQTETLPNLDAKTRNFADREDSTKRFDNAQFQNMFESPSYQPPALYQTAKLAETAIEKPTSRKVANIGLPENVLLILSYCPFQVGLIASFVQLLFVPKSEAKVRFHAAQGFTIHLAILLITAILGFIAGLIGFGGFAKNIFFVSSLVLLVFSMFKVWKGNPVHFEAIEEFTDIINDKISIDFFKKLFKMDK
jgi:uncharacterized membrane protein